MGKKKVSAAKKKSRVTTTIDIPVQGAATTFNRELARKLNSGALSTRWVKRIVRLAAGWRVYLGQ